jgi:hypothetical protein
VLYVDRPFIKKKYQMRNFFRRAWIVIQRFFRWVFKLKFTKIALRELFSFAISYLVTIKVWHLSYFTFFYTFVGSYLISFFTYEWILTIGKRKNDLLTWMSRGFALFVIYQLGLTVVDNVMPQPHDIKYYNIGFIAGILGYLISNAIKKVK